MNGTTSNKIPDAAAHGKAVNRMKIFKKRDDLFVASIMGMSGMYSGAIFRLDAGETITFGRDPKTSQIVLDERFENVSRTHCTVYADASTQTYFVTDCSSNGTFIDGKKMRKGARVEVPRGTMIALGDQRNTFRLN